MRVTLQPAYVLHYRAYRETSLLLDVLTEEYGRIALIAKGVRSMRSHVRPLLQPFIPLLLSWQGKSELMNLIEAEVKAVPLPLRGDCLLSGFYLNELLIRLLQKNDPHPVLYAIYQQALIELQSSQLDQKILRIFEKKLLAELGYAIPLEYDFLTGKVLQAEAFYRYVHEHGFTICDPLNSSHIFSGKSLLALAEERWGDDDSLRDTKRLMRILFASILGSNEIHSRKLFI